MPRVIEADRLDLREFIRPGDHVVWGEATGEPLTLSEALVAQRSELGGVGVFVGVSYSATLRPEHTDHLTITGYGAMGTLRALGAAGRLGLLGCHVGQIPRYLESGLIGSDVVLVQVSSPDASGRHSFGVTNDYVQAAIGRARVVIAEVNARVPFTYCDELLGPERIDVIVESDRPVLSVPPAEIGDVERAIARHASAFIDDGSVLQFGIGAIPDAITQLLGDRRDLGVHSGMVSDGLVDLVEKGVVTNAAKPMDRGVSVTGLLVGTERLYAFADRNPAVAMRASSYTHGDAVLNKIPRLVTMNSAVEVDLTGQINAEQADDDYLGGIGGHADYVRAGQRSPGGHAIVALPATAKAGTRSRITNRLTGPVTTPRSDVDLVVTEFGAAELQGCTLAQRARRLIEVAHPAFREDLERGADRLLRRGY